jgi:hypothetical protein
VGTKSLFPHDFSDQNAVNQPSCASETSRKKGHSPRSVSASHSLRCGATVLLLPPLHRVTRSSAAARLAQRGAGVSCAQVYYAPPHDILRLDDLSYRATCHPPRYHIVTPSHAAERTPIISSLSETDDSIRSTRLAGPLLNVIFLMLPCRVLCACQSSHRTRTFRIFY